MKLSIYFNHAGNPVLCIGRGFGDGDEVPDLEGIPVVFVGENVEIEHAYGIGA